MEIRPASLAQVQRARNGQMVQIDNDVLGVAQQLKEIDEGLHLRYSEAGGYFVIYYVDPEKKTEYMVSTMQELDPRAIERMRQISSSSYDLIKEVEKQEAQAEKDRDHQIRENAGPVAERLAHAVRKDLGDTSRIFVPGSD